MTQSNGIILAHKDPGTCTAAFILSSGLPVRMAQSTGGEYGRYNGTQEDRLIVARAPELSSQIEQKAFSDGLGHRLELSDVSFNLDAINPQTVIKQGGIAGILVKDELTEPDYMSSHDADNISVATVNIGAIRRSEPFIVGVFDGHGGSEAANNAAHAIAKASVKAYNNPDYLFFN